MSDDRIKVQLLDVMGYDVGQPEVPLPLPRVIVWGSEFFIGEPAIGPEAPTYRQTTGFVVVETKETRF
jgi:hypothetical protein